MAHMPPQSLVILMVLVLGGCAWYTPAPLEPDEEWRALQRIRLTDLVVSSPEEVAPGGGAFPAFDYSDGLSSEEAAGLAVVMNPTLRASRHERGIAEGQLVTAGLLPNPEIESIWLFPSGPISWAGEVNALFDLTQALVTRGPRRERARIRTALPDDPKPRRFQRSPRGRNDNRHAPVHPSRGHDARHRRV